MTFQVYIPDSADGLKPWTVFHKFAQRMANRLVQGGYRYGKISASQRYMSRMQKELDAYKSSGNTEHLYNLANYAYLEYVAPEHKRQHEDNTVGSATRKKFGGAIA